MLSDFHVHTYYCDGKSSPEEHLEKARKLGVTTLGFSSHAPADVASDWRMTEEVAEQYLAHVRALAAATQDVEILVGMEADPNTTADLSALDYHIGSVHDLSFEDGTVLSVDTDFETSEYMVKTYFGGDWLSYAAAYFREEIKMTERLSPLFWGHIDLVTKFNEQHPAIDCTDVRYRRAATDAMDALLSVCPITEINTGVMTRIGRSEPYPSLPLLTYWRERGGKIVFCSDGHRESQLCACFDAAKELARRAGFDSAVTFHKQNGKVTAVPYQI